MKDSIINYEIAFANFTQKIKKMAVGNIKKTGIKKKNTIEIKAISFNYYKVNQ